MAKNRKQRGKRSRGNPAVAAASRQVAAAVATPRQGAMPRRGAGGGLAAAMGAYQHWWPVGLLALLVVVGLWPAFSALYVWDDGTFLLEAKPVQTWGGLLDIWFNPSSMVEGHYWPMVYTSFWLEHKLWGYNAAGFHSTNLMLHWLNSALLWGLLKRLGVPGALLIAAVFALHPVHVEPAAWVISRKDLLGTFFYLLAAGCWLRYREAPKTGAYLALMGFFVAGLLSKSFVITLPAALLVWAWWKQGRIAKADFMQTVPLFAVGLIIVIGDLSFYFGRAVLSFDFSFAERLIIVGKALWFYAGKLLWPQPLPIIYPKWSISPSQLLNWLPLLGAMALTLGLWLARHRIGRGALAGALFFAITLSPMLGFANNSYMSISFVADRYQYLASAGILAVLIAGAVIVCQRLASGTLLGALAREADGQAPSDAADNGQGVSGRPAQRAAVLYSAGALAALLLACYGWLSFQQARVYRDPLTYFSHIAKLNPGEYNGHYNLGLALMDLKRYEEAETPARRAIEIEPNSSSAYQNLAVITHNLGRYEETLAALKKATELADKQTAEQFYHIGHIAAEVKRYDEAEQYLLQALDMDPGNPDFTNQLMFVYLGAGRYADALTLDPNIVPNLMQMGASHFNQGNYAEALERYQHAAAIDPKDADIHLDLGTVMVKLKGPEEALKHYEQALAIDPERQAALRQVATIHYQQTRYEQALQGYRRLIALAPDDASAHAEEGLALVQLNRWQEAQSSFERALELDPSQHQALSQLAARYFETGQYEQALALFQQILTLTPNSAEAHSNLGSALAQLGRFQEAKKSFERALQLDPSLASARHNIDVVREKLKTAQ